jgi:ParB-like chromosome segregation protein Spo0J
MRSSATLLDHPAIEMWPLRRLKPYRNNARTHSAEQIRQIAASIKRFGFTNPVLVDGTGAILAGHGRVNASKALGLTVVPVIRIAHLSEAEKRAYILADNRIAENAGWDRQTLAIEIEELLEILPPRVSTSRSPASPRRRSTD